MIILKDYGEVDALQIIKSCGYIDTTPETSLCTSKIFVKDGKKFMFNGWHKLVNRTWKDIELIALNEK